MNKIILTLIVVISFCLPPVCSAKSAKRLVTINAIEYTNDDFANWWKHWNDKDDLKTPDSPDDFITFQLMVQQGKEMGYDTKPSYLRKVDVFLQVRAMLSLKFEEIDSKVIVTDSDLKKYFDKNFSNLWLLQILAFDSEDKARLAYDYILPFNGQIAGRLVFADLYGGVENEKASTYDEVKVSVADFHKNKLDAWLPVVEKLGIGEVSQPIVSEDGKKFILLRLVEKQLAEEGVFEEKKQKISELVYKEKKDRLSIDLLEKLRRKYKVRVEEKLFDEIKLDVDYPKEFLERKVVSMSEFEVTVNDFIYNALKEKKIRKSVPDEVIKGLVLESIISQTIISKESLARGYEKRPPLLATFEFYRQNRLRAEVEAGLLDSVVVSEQDLLKFYDTNIANFTVPEKATFSFVEGEENVLRKVWVGTLQGGDFIELADKYSLKAHTQNKALDSLSPEMVSELKKLDKGGVSMPFAIEGNYGLLKLVDRSAGQVQSLEQIRSSVLEQLKKEKFEMIKAEYLTKLKSRSKVDINKRVWDDLVRELGNGKKD